MANYYTDHPEIAFYFQHPLMRRIVELREKGFADKDLYPEAPVDYEDCIENYKRILEVVGDITANIIAPNSESVDLEGPHLENGRMIYASKTVENMEAMLFFFFLACSFSTFACSFSSLACSLASMAACFSASFCAWSSAFWSFGV